MLVTMNVPSTTTMGAGGCAPGLAGVSNFGTVLPGSSSVTSADCAVTFGSSNDTSSIRVFQSDRAGTSAMSSPTSGVLDPAFSPGGFEGSGRLLGDFIGTVDFAAGVAAQSSGRIIAVGRVQNGANNDAGLARYNLDGSLDATFSPGGVEGSGRALHDTGSDDEAKAVLVQPDDKIVIAAVGGADFQVARFDPNGALDLGFSPGGVEGSGANRIDFTGNSDIPTSVALTSEGKILLAGYSSNGTNPDFALAQFNADGTLDTSFGVGGPEGSGLVRTDVGGGDAAFAMTLQPDGRILAAGYSSNGANDDLTVVRYLADGTLDSAFSPGGADGSGVVRTDILAGNDYVRGIVVLPDGSIVVGGETQNGGVTSLALARYSSVGVLDTTFAVGGPEGSGIARVSSGTADWGRALLRQADGMLVLAGGSSNGANYDFGVARFTADGQIDTGFSPGGPEGSGFARHDFGGTADAAYGMVEVDGSLVVAGQAGNDMGVELFGASALPNFASGISDWSTSGTGHFGACLRSAPGAITDGTTWTADTVDADCADGNADPWKPVAAGPLSSGSKVASASSGTTNGQVNLRFGIRIPASQPPGAYFAPITFEVVAPAV